MSGAEPVRVLLADDQALLRAGLRMIVDATADLRVVGEAATGREAVARAGAADVVLMDIRMPDLDGLAATRLIAADPALAATRVLVLTTFEIDEYVFQALRAGAAGFLGKGAEPDEVRAAIRTVARGDALLSPAATATLISRFLREPEPPDPTRPAAPALLGVLTEREREIVAMVAAGLSNDAIADRLTVSPATVKTHVNRAMAKLDARSRAQLVVLAFRSGLVTP